MLGVAVVGPTREDVRRQISAALPLADLVELRIDRFDAFDLDFLKSLKFEFSIPMIFTLRSHSQGGEYAGSEDERLERLQQLASLRPAYLDLEYHIPVDVYAEIVKGAADVQIICSYHDFYTTPNDIDVIYRQLKMRPATLYKLAFMAASTIDALRLLCWAKNAGRDIIAISMGGYGQISRVLAPVVGSRITYASGEQETAPGQLTAEELRDVYRYNTLNRSTKVFGLFGGNVEKIISHTFHNKVMKAAGVDAVYVKMSVSADQLPQAMHYARLLPFSGLSVTMPLKEAIMPLLDGISPEADDIGAVNTLVFVEDHVSGYNTDALGALNAIEEVVIVKGKRLVLIGAGGAAKAIAYEAVERGAHVTVLNRDAHKAQELAARLKVRGAGLEEMQKCFDDGYDILINSTPAQMPITAAHIIPRCVVMDIKWPAESEFCAAARAKDCTLVSGSSMFMEQAKGQYQLWFNDNS